MQKEEEEEIDFRDYELLVVCIITTSTTSATSTCQWPCAAAAVISGMPSSVTAFTSPPAASKLLAISTCPGHLVMLHPSQVKSQPHARHPPATTAMPSAVAPLAVAATSAL